MLLHAPDAMAIYHACLLARQAACLLDEFADCFSGHFSCRAG
jgi:hypothetical protein